MGCSNIISDFSNMECGSTPPKVGRTYAITIKPEDQLAVTIDYGGMGKTESLIVPSGLRVDQPDPKSVKDSNSVKFVQEFSFRQINIIGDIE